MEPDIEKIDNLDVKPVINNKQMQNGELVGDALSIISIKNLSDDFEPDLVVKRNSFRDVHHPDISYLNWVKESGSKEEVDLVLSASYALCCCLIREYFSVSVSFSYATQRSVSPK